MQFDIKLQTDESGQTLIVAARGMAVIVGFPGLSVDGGQLRYARRNLQSAANAAAVAAAMEIQTCAGTANCSAMQAAAQNSLAENGLTGSTITTNCSTAAVTGLVLSLNNPACALGTADTNHGNNAHVEVVRTQPQTT